MMLLEEEYVNADEPSGVSVADNGCMWAGCLYQRKSGGFDLFYDHANSDLNRSMSNRSPSYGIFAPLIVVSSLSPI
jgi:hypothetical protein